MDYEKKYKEALRKATKIHRDDNEEIKHYMEVLFPELAESKDEKIRKKLIENFKWFCGDYLNTTKWGKDDMLVKDIITWLEKQESVDENEVAKRVLNEVANSIMRWLDSNCAESNTFLPAMECEDIENAVRNANWQKIYGYMKKKLEKQDNTAKEVTCTQEVEVGNGNIKALVTEEMPADKVEPKFHEGDWVVFNNKHQSIYQVEKIEDGYYILRHTHGGTFRVCVLHDKSLRLWTTQDAKDGDVLVGKINGDKYIIIFKRIKDVWVETHGHYNGTLNRFCMPSHMFCRDYQGTFTPATQEQRDLLFKRMKEAGYAWDEEKKGIEDD